MAPTQVGRYLAGSLLAVALLGTSAASADGGAPVNTAIPSVGRADHQDQFALDVGQPVLAVAGTWTGALAYSYRFSRCPTPTLDGSCTALGTWQPDAQASYDRSSAGQYAVVEVEATDAAGTSTPVASQTKLLTIPPALNPAGIHLTGGLPDSTIAPGSPVDVSLDPTAIAGVPAPSVKIVWEVSDGPAGSDVIQTRDTPYAGPLAAPRTLAGEAIGIQAAVTVTNPGGVATARSSGLYDRSKPVLSNSCFCAFDPAVPPPLRPHGGDRIPVTALELGTHLGLPRLVAGVPTPQVTTQWLRCRNGHCTTISRATKASYVAIRRDIGYSLRVRVTARNPLGSYSLDLLTPGHLAVRAAAKPKHHASAHL
jgi:hypothetical protein